MKEVYAGHHPNYTPKETKHWDLAKNFPIGDKIYQFLDENCWEIYQHAKPYDGAREMCLQLKNNKHRINIISSAFTTPEVATATVVWIAGNKIPHDSLCFTNTKWHVYSHIFLDDSPEHLDMIRRNTHFTPICFTRSWNEGNDKWSGLRVKSHAEFLSYVEMFRTTVITGWGKA